MERPRKAGQSDDVPAWGWLALGALRLWALLPLALLVAGLWWWTHGGARQAPRLLRQAAQHARAFADSVLGR